MYMAVNHGFTLHVWVDINLISSPCSLYMKDQNPEIPPDVTSLNFHSILPFSVLRYWKTQPSAVTPLRFEVAFVVKYMYNEALYIGFKRMPTHQRPLSLKKCSVAVYCNPTKTHPCSSTTRFTLSVHCSFKQSIVNNSFKLWLFSVFLWTEINHATGILEKWELILHSWHEQRIPLCLWITWGGWEWWGKKKKNENGAACVNCTERKKEEDEGFNGGERELSFPYRIISDCKWFKEDYCIQLGRDSSQFCLRLRWIISFSLSEISCRVFMVIYVTFRFISMLAFFFNYTDICFFLA